MKMGSSSPKRLRAELSVCLWVGLLWCVFVLSEVHEFCAVFCVKFMSSKVTAEGSDRNIIQCCRIVNIFFPQILRCQNTPQQTSKQTQKA